MSRSRSDDTAVPGGCSCCSALPACLATAGGHRPAARRVHTLQRGDRLEPGPGDHCLRFWTVVDGWTASCTVLADGRRQIIGLERVGDVICAGMARDGSENWLEALTDARVCELDLSANAEALRGDP